MTKIVKNLKISPQLLLVLVCLMGLLGGAMTACGPRSHEQAQGPTLFQPQLPGQGLRGENPVTNPISIDLGPLPHREEGIKINPGAKKAGEQARPPRVETPQSGESRPGQKAPDISKSPALNQRITKAHIRVFTILDSIQPHTLELSTQIKSRTQGANQQLSFKLPLKDLRGHLRGAAQVQADNGDRFSLTASCPKLDCSTIDFVMTETADSQGDFTPQEVRLKFRMDVQFFVKNEDLYRPPPLVLPEEYFQRPSTPENEELSLLEEDDFAELDAPPLPLPTTPDGIIERAAEERWPVQRFTLSVDQGPTFSRVIINNPDPNQSSTEPLLILDEDPFTDEPPERAGSEHYQDMPEVIAEEDLREDGGATTELLQDEILAGSTSSEHSQDEVFADPNPGEHSQDEVLVDASLDEIQEQPVVPPRLVEIPRPRSKPEPPTESESSPQFEAPPMPAAPVQTEPTQSPSVQTEPRPSSPSAEEAQSAPAPVSQTANIPVPRKKPENTTGRPRPAPQPAASAAPAPPRSGPGSAQQSIRPLYRGSRYSLVSLPDILTVGQINQLSLGERVAAIARALVRAGHQVPSHACNFFIADVLLLAGYNIPQVVRANEYDQILSRQIGSHSWNKFEFRPNEKTSIKSFLFTLAEDEAVIIQKRRSSGAGHVAIIVREGPDLFAVYDSSLNSRPPSRRVSNSERLVRYLTTGRRLVVTRIFRARSHLSSFYLFPRTQSRPASLAS